MTSKLWRGGFTYPKGEHEQLVVDLVLQERMLICKEEEKLEASVELNLKL